MLQVHLLLSFKGFLALLRFWLRSPKRARSVSLLSAAIAEDSIKIEMNGNMASARFNASIKAAFKGKEMVTYQLRVLEVWTKKGNRWVLFARQAVPVVPISH